MAGEKQEWALETHQSRWFSPESLKSMENFTDKSHVWTLAICFWELYSRGNMPYGDVTDTLGKLGLNFM